VFDCPGLSHSVIGFAETGFTIKRSGGGTEGSGFFVRWVELEVCLEVGWNELEREDEQKQNVGCDRVRFDFEWLEEIKQERGFQVCCMTRIKTF
jgi:hypothetical protein